MRQTAGYFEDFWRNKNLDIGVPSFGRLSDLFSKVPLKVRQFCEEAIQRVNNFVKRLFSV